MYVNSSVSSFVTLYNIILYLLSHLERKKENFFFRPGSARSEEQRHLTICDNSEFFSSHGLSEDALQ